MLQGTLLWVISLFFLNTLTVNFMLLLSGSFLIPFCYNWSEKGHSSLRCSSLLIEINANSGVILRFHPLKISRSMCWPEKFLLLFIFLCFAIFRSPNGIIDCYGYQFLRGFYLRADNQATNDFLDYGECCKPQVESSPYHYKCYDKSVSFFGKLGLFKCKDHYYITQIRTRGCRQLHCIDRIRCCRMKTEGSSMGNTKPSFTRPAIFAHL